MNYDCYDLLVTKLVAPVYNNACMRSMLDPGIAVVHNKIMQFLGNVLFSLLFDIICHSDLWFIGCAVDML